MSRKVELLLERLRVILDDPATYNRDPKILEYEKIRTQLMQINIDYLPSFVIVCENLGQFRKYIQKFKQFNDRRAFFNEEIDRSMEDFRSAKLESFDEKSKDFNNQFKPNEDKIFNNNINENTKSYNGSIGNEIPSDRSKKKSIFIVHGHDNEMKESVARFIERLDLNAIILHEQANLGLTIIEKFENYSDECDFAIILLSPDDIGGTNNDGSKLSPRARQNVIFELGYFFGKLGRKKVCTLIKSDIEKPSDYNGIVYLNYDVSHWKIQIVKELKTAGFELDFNKISDYL